MKVDTCGFLLYHRNRELHALFIIGLNCQDKKKRFTRFHLYDKLQTDKKSFNSPHDVTETIIQKILTMSGKQSIIKPARTFSGNLAFIPSKQLILSIFVHHVCEAGFAFFLLLFPPSSFPFSIRHFVICVGVSK